MAKDKEQTGSRLFYLYPEIHHARQYEDDFYRAVFYLSPLIRRHDLLLIASSRDDSPYDHAPSAAFDGMVSDLAERIRDRVAVCPLEEAGERFERFEGQRTVCLWDERLHDHDPFLKNQDHFKVLRADHRLVQHSSSHYLRASSYNGQGTADQCRVAQQRLHKRLESLKHDRILLFGTGPALERVNLAELPPGVPIATNSMVKNKPMLDAMRPKIVVASDPIFHAGVSKYAQQFRQELVEALRLYDASFVFPMRDIGLYETILPDDVRERLIGIPTNDGPKINFDLFKTFSVTTTRNVMTHFLLPLAATLARDVLLAGFDGRRPEENDYFWSHSKSSQFIQEIPSIQEAHPAFFAIDYNDYYREHCKVVETYLHKMEQAGHRVFSMTDSHIPAVHSRFIEKTARRSWPRRGKRRRVSIVMPVSGPLELLKEAVASVQAQTIDDWELLAIPYGQTRKGAAMDWLQEEARTESRLEILTQEASSLPAALNLGLAAAAAHFVAFFSGTARLYPNALQRRLQALCGDADISVCAGRVDLVDLHGHRLKLRRGRLALTSLRHARSSPFHLSTLLGRAQVMKRFRFDVCRPYDEAWHFSLQILQNGFTIGSCGEDPLCEVHCFGARERFNDPLGRYAYAKLMLDSLLHPPPSCQSAKGIPVVLSESQVARARVRFLQVQFAAQVLIGDREAQRCLLRIFAEEPAVTFLQPLTLKIFEEIAIRCFAKPRSSRALHRSVVNRYDHIFDACERLQKIASQKDFSVAFRSFAIAAAKSLAAAEKRKLKLGAAERRVHRQGAWILCKNRLLRLRFELGDAFHAVRKNTQQSKQDFMEWQRELRRRWKRWRRQSKQKVPSR
ncbi:MAG: glycosyltransferase [Rhodospirillales bacterium]|nr:glycosyltransferase [Rhodospirillales bacterium]